MGIPSMHRFCKKCGHDEWSHIDIRIKILTGKEGKPKKCTMYNCKCRKFK
jgi:hypothetical protein